jgi:hypothetical protein
VWNLGFYVEGRTQLEWALELGVEEKVCTNEGGYGRTLGKKIHKKELRNSCSSRNVDWNVQIKNIKWNT